jgi:hypothetical protein
MDKAHKPSDCESYTPSSEHCKFYMSVKHLTYGHSAVVSVFSCLTRLCHMNIIVASISWISHDMYGVSNFFIDLYTCFSVVEVFNCTGSA